MKVAILYFGKSRSIRHTYKTHHRHVFDAMKAADIEFDVFMHLWHTAGNVVWGRESGVPEDEGSYPLLAPDHLEKDRQDEFLKTIDFGRYFYEHVYREFGHSVHGEWKPCLVRNHICALESQRRVFRMAERAGRAYDAYLVIRPDAFFESGLDVAVLRSVQPGTLFVPRWKSCEGYNDRLAFGCRDVMWRYTHRLDDLPEFRLTKGRIVAEKCLKLMVEKYGFSTVPLSVRFKLCRPDGTLR